MSRTKHSICSYAGHTGYGLVAWSKRDKGLREICASAVPYAIASIVLAMVLFYLPL